MKCGQTSLLNTLVEHAKVSYGFPVRLKKEQPDWSWGNVPKYDTQWDNHFKFTVVRNPWARLLSAYTNKIRDYRSMEDNELRAIKYGTNNMHKKYGHINSFTEFVHNIHETDMIGLDGHIKLQTDMLPLDKIDFIGKLENIHNDFNTICDNINIPRVEPMHMNRTNHRHYTEYYDDELRDMVAEKYAKDIEVLGYKFGE